MKNIAYTSIAGFCIGVATSCSQLPEAAVPKSESLSTSAATKSSDSMSRNDSASEKSGAEGSVQQPAPEASPTAQPSQQPTITAGDCNNLSSVKTDTISITIRKNNPSSGGMQCPFGMGDNAPKNDGKYAARLEFNQGLNLPADRKLCGINPSAATQSINYDDHLFVNLNGFVLLASRGIPSEFAPDASGFRKYDWAKLVNTERGSNVKCGEGVTCQIPATETTGNFAFSLSEDARKKLFTAIGDKPLQYSVVVTGDNNSSTDCKLQNDLTLTLNYSYVAK
jgi:hypothetical protein